MRAHYLNRHSSWAFGFPPRATPCLLLVRTTPNSWLEQARWWTLKPLRACLDAGAAFITGPGTDIDIVEFTVRNNIDSVPGALTPGEVVAA